MQPLAQLEWVPRSRLRANTWNPNHVAPTELALLATSLVENGWTQPIVAHYDEAGELEITDGYHRWTLSGQRDDVAALTAGLRPGPNPSPREKELEKVLLDLLDAVDADADTKPASTAAYDLLARYDREDKADPGDVLVPVVTLDPATDLATRQMATIRHNRARGAHHVLKMADIVVELAAAGVPDKEIARRVGMDTIEVERLKMRGRMAVRGASVDGELRRAWHAEMRDDDE